MAIVIPNIFANPALGERSQPVAHGHPAADWIADGAVIGMQPESPGQPGRPVQGRRDCRTHG
jgi:hypothetical protein